MRKISANYVFPITRPPIKNGILVLENDGTIIDVIDPKDQFKEFAGLEFYNGILTPGFVNAHCHIELSYLKNKIGSCCGLPDFLNSIVKTRVQIPENIEKIIANADAEMHSEGIVAVGDIINGSNSLKIKKKSKLIYKSFVETYDISPTRTELCIKNATKLKDEVTSNSLFASIVPHAPYSVTPQLFSFIKNSYNNRASIYSIHNQETESENLIFSSQKGTMYEMMSSSGAEYSLWSTAQSSLKAISVYFPEESNILLIHNVYMNEQDVSFLKKENYQIFLVLCPASNLIIENRLPDIRLLKQSGFPICIGTDSYASNTRLSVLEELKVISNNYPEIELQELFQWACLNGAMALKEDSKLGSFEKNKKPGVNLVEGVDFEKMQLTEGAKVRVLCS